MMASIKASLRCSLGLALKRRDPTDPHHNVRTQGFCAAFLGPGPDWGTEDVDEGQLSIGQTLALERIAGH